MVRLAVVLAAAPVRRCHVDDAEVEQHGPGGVEEHAVVGPVPAVALAPGPERRFGVVHVGDGEIVQGQAGLDQQPDDDPLGRPGADVRREAERCGSVLVSVEVLFQAGAAGEFDEAGELPVHQVVIAGAEQVVQQQERDERPGLLVLGEHDLQRLGREGLRVGQRRRNPAAPSAKHRLPRPQAASQPAYWRSSASAADGRAGSALAALAGAGIVEGGADVRRGEVDVAG